MGRRKETPQDIFLVKGPTPRKNGGNMETSGIYSGKLQFGESGL